MRQPVQIISQDPNAVVRRIALTIGACAEYPAAAKKIAK